MNSTYYYSSFDPVNCAVRPIGSSLVWGGIFSAMDAVQGRRVTPRSVGLYVGALYVYSALQCPMEAMNGGRPSAWHNVASGALLGYIGVRAGVLGIPFVDSFWVYRNPHLAPELVGAAAYGGIAGALAMVGGKPF